MGWQFWKREPSEAEQTLAALNRPGSMATASTPATPATGFSMTVEDAFSITGRGTVDTAGPGTNVGLMLAGVSREQVAAGDTITG